MTELDPPQPSPSVLLVRGISAVMGGTVSVLWLLMAFIAGSSLFASGPAEDPHGYGLMFGSLLAVPLAIFAATVLPFALPPGQRRRGFAVTIPVFAIGTALLFVIWFAQS